MSDLYIGLSSYQAAQKAIETIGNNIANSVTEGYHRQEISFTPAYMSSNSGTTVGGGVEVTEVRRIVDDLIEGELLSQRSSLAQYSRELTTMSSIESAFGELSSASGLNNAIDEFFTSLRDVSSHTGDIIYQTDLVSMATMLTEKFNSLGGYLSDMKTAVQLELENSVDDANTLITLIADLNDQIHSLSITGANPNNLIDTRDQNIAKLSEMINIHTTNSDNNVVNVMISGIPVVMDAQPMEIELGYNEAGKLGISAAGAYTYDSSLDGGTIGGLLYLNNDFISGLQGQLDTLANAVSTEINNLHVQGISTKGSFDELSSNFLTSNSLSGYSSTISDGYLYLRVTNTSTGEVTRAEIEIDVDNDSFGNVATAISAVTGVTASYVNNQLLIKADSGYDFDFCPAILPEEENSTLTGTVPDIELSGVYKGDSNDTFTFTVSGTGSVGNGSLELVVTNGDGDVVGSVDVGSGYAPGEDVTLSNGITISVGVGELNNGESFDVDVFASTDTSGFLSAVGLNSFFTGTTATTLSVSSRLMGDPSLISTSLGADVTNNDNIARMAGLVDEGVGSLSGLTIGEYYKQMVTDMGQEVSLTATKQESAESIVSSLELQQGNISGVDVNDEAAKMLVFQQMIQASAKYMQTIQESLETIIGLL